MVETAVRPPESAIHHFHPPEDELMLDEMEPSDFLHEIGCCKSARLPSQLAVVVKNRVTPNGLRW